MPCRERIFFVARGRPREGRLRMSAFLKAVEFIAQSQVERFFSSTVEVLSLKPGWTADVYRPRGKSLGAVLVVHGMTMRGHRDPRMINVCRAFAGSGYTAIAPLYHDIATLRITVESIYSIAESIQILTKMPDICPAGKIGLFSASFSAGMSLIAASLPETANLVSSVCTVGTLGAIDSTVKFLLAHNNDIDDYGTMIVLGNFIHLSIGRDEQLEKAFEVAAYDNGLRREKPLLGEFLDSIGEKSRNLFLLLQKNSAERMKHWEVVRVAPGFAKFLTELAVDRRISGMKAAVSLIHGIGDDVIPPSESELVFAKLKEAGVPVKLTLTPLISHGDASIGISMVGDIVRLARSFAFFFNHL